MEKYLIKLSKAKESSDIASKEPSKEPSKDAPSTSKIISSLTNSDHSDDNESDDSDYSMEVAQDVISQPKKKYKQNFREIWTTEFKWLENKEGNFLCKVCNKSITGGSFYIKRHENSSMHKDHIKAAQNTVSLKEYAENHPVKKRFNKVKQAELKLTAYLCEHNLPFLLMDTLPELMKDIFPDSKIAANLKLKRKKSTQLCVGVIGPAAKDEVVTDLQSTMFSLIIDETTDVSTSKSLVVIARYWKNNRVCDRFLDLIQVESSTAESLFNSIINMLTAAKIPHQNIIGFAADNASVMMGDVKGVKARFLKIVPHIFIQGCTCHSLHLCASNACKKLPNNVEQFARDIYTYFSNSSKRLEELNECQIFVKEKPKKMLYPSQTRWLSLRMVADRVLSNWDALTLFFQRAALEDNLPTAKAILNALNNKIYKLHFLFLAYVLEIVTRINLEFQSEDSKLPLLLERVSMLYKIILKCFVRKEIVEQGIHNVDVSNPRNFMPLEKMYFGANVDVLLSDANPCDALNKQDVHNFKLRALDFYIELCKQIQSRFNFNNPHLKYASNFTPTVALSGDVLSLANVANLFPYIHVDIELLNLDWQLLAECENLKAKKNMKINEFWSEINNMKNALGEQMFPHLMKVVKVIMSLPHSSAAAERVFSQLNLMKTKTRNRLHVSTCSQILHVKDMLNMYSKGTIGWKPQIKSTVDIRNIVVDDQDIF